MKNFLLPILLLLCLTTSAQNIFITACRGNLTRLDSLLEHTSIDVQDHRGRSLLHWALGCNQPEVFEYLLEKGINIHQEDNQQRTALYPAVHFNHHNAFDRLVALQENDAWIEDDGPSLLERAVLNKNEAFVRKLIESGVDINDSNERGSTPLEIAQRIHANELVEVLLSLGADVAKVRNIQMKGLYMGQFDQDASELKSYMFAPNFISTEESEFGAVFNAAGTEFYFGVDVNGKSETRYSQLVDGQWTEPITLLSHERYGYNDPFLSPDENRLYVISKRALDGIGELKDHDIWYVQREATGWSEPINAGRNINSDGNEYYISFTHDGTMYFASNGHPGKERESDDFDIYYSRYIDGVFQPAVILSDSINSTAYEADVFISPDESYIIFCSTREGGMGLGDLYISFKNSEGQWTQAINMGEKINTQYYEYCPFVTMDGKYLMYTSNQDIYWISTDIIAELKNR